VYENGYTIKGAWELPAYLVNEIGYDFEPCNKPCTKSDIPLGVVYRRDLVAQIVNDFGCGRWMTHTEMCYNIKVSGFDGKTVFAAADVISSSITAANH
jgi:hypothetical protein